MIAEHAKSVSEAVGSASVGQDPSYAHDHRSDQNDETKDDDHNAPPT